VIEALERPLQHMQLKRLEADRYPYSLRILVLRDILAKFGGRRGKDGDCVADLGLAVFDRSSPLDNQLSRRHSHLSRSILFCRIVVIGLTLALAACADFKKDFLCRPDGHCLNATAGHTPTQ
jgi:hypothetical protein